MLYDPWTGKPVDKLSDFLPTPNGKVCEDCGSECISRCPRCGAPQCCPKCCFEANETNDGQ